MFINVASKSTIFGSINTVSPVAGRVPPSRYGNRAARGRRDVNQDVQLNTALIRTALP